MWFSPIIYYFISLQVFFLIDAFPLKETHHVSHPQQGIWNTLPASVFVVALTTTEQKHPFASARYTWFSWPSTHRTWILAGSVWSIVIAFPTDGFLGQVHSLFDKLSLLKFDNVLSERNDNKGSITSLLICGKIIFWTTSKVSVILDYYRPELNLPDNFYHILLNSVNWLWRQNMHIKIYDIPGMHQILQ